MKIPFKYSIGNAKLGKDTLIFNMTSATECPSARLGLCQLKDSNKCYALKAERMYPSVLPYRRAQAKYWAKTKAFDIIQDIYNALYRHKGVKYIRVNESGDFRTQEDVDKLRCIASAIPGVTFYMYTARKDLKRENMPKNLIITGSGFMADNCFKVAYDNKSKGPYCPGACENCTLCKVKSGKTINVLIH